jgi:hypothetical protein
MTSCSKGTLCTVRLMLWGGSPIVGVPPTWPPSPPIGFWPPTGPGFWHSPPQPYPDQPSGTPPPTDVSGVPAITDAVGSSTWRVGVAALWIASVEDTASTYNFHTTHGKTSLCKNRFHIFT